MQLNPAAQSEIYRESKKIEREREKKKKQKYLLDFPEACVCARAR